VSKASKQSENTPGLWALVREDWIANGRDWTQPGFRAVAVHRFGAWRMGLRFTPMRMLCSFIYKRMFRYVRNHYGIELYYTASVGRRLQIGHQGAIVVHDHATIGEDCVLRQGVTIGAARLGPGREPPQIGSRVTIGAGAVIIGSVTIGDDVTIGPNAVVMNNVPSGATVTAMPARVIPAATPRAVGSAGSAGASDTTQPGATAAVDVPSAESA
jgi:serine O-acetyltransferase